MKSTTKYLSLAALALMGTLASCQSDDEAAVSFARPDNAVGINVTVGSLKGTTRSNPAATDDTQREFKQGDQISVSTDGQDPVLFQCQDADMQTWAEAEAGKFLLWTQNEMVFQAYYPATTGTSMTAFTLPTDQSTEAKIALADYMIRQQTCDNEYGTDITLNLERKTARVIVRIAGFTDQYDNDHKTVSNVRINSQYSTINDGNGNGDVTAVTPYMQGNGGQGSTFTALVVPGDGDDGADFITLTDGENNTLTVKGIPELREGYSYTYNLTVGKNRINVASVTVTDWTTGETLAGGQATSVPVTAITLNKTETSIEVGSTETLSVTAVAPDNATDKTYTWKTSDASKATVDQDGKVTAVAEGIVTIYAEANDGSGVKGNCTVTVTPAIITVTTITLNKTATSIKVGSTETLSVTAVAPDNATDKTYTWKTSDASKATVDQDGKVTAVAAGTVTIYAEANDGSGVKGNCTVTVTPAIITVTWNNSDISSSGTSFTKDGVTMNVTGDLCDFSDKNFSAGTFTSTVGNFTKIEVTACEFANMGSGWTIGYTENYDHKVATWTGTASSTVSFGGSDPMDGIWGMDEGVTMVFTIEPAN